MMIIGYLDEFVKQNLIKFCFFATIAHFIKDKNGKFTQNISNTSWRWTGARR